MAESVKETWLWLGRDDLATELRQLEDEGRDTSPLRGEFDRLIALGDEALFVPSNQDRAGALLDAAQQVSMRRGYAFQEPSELAEIRKLRRRVSHRMEKRLPAKELEDRLLGAGSAGAPAVFWERPSKERTPASSGAF